MVVVADKVGSEGDQAPFAEAPAKGLMRVVNLSSQ